MTHAVMDYRTGEIVFAGSRKACIRRISSMPPEVRRFMVLVDWFED